ncbi:type II toxin-antitoxin system VapC family toxin [Synechococcus sp. CBW1002]|uniref:type II toxin-antitoxin system VapC family toxin n=1 Tax=Synechococcus sp. CBW1002 TaxID=1353134 RepID=UPI001E3D82FE|nr:type II toxin-antitoxin system VapC family toxin [Synechococcus sp. CBW1002]
MRLPKDYRFSGREVAVKRFGNGVLLLPIDDPWQLLEAGLEAFEPGCDQPMILLDTNICIYIINAKPAAVVKRFKQFRMGEIGLCSVVAAEWLSGWPKAARPVITKRWRCFSPP